MTDTATETFEYTLPSLGADMDAGRVIEWQVAIGDTVHRGDIIARVETEKSDIDIEIWHDGIVEEFLVELQREIPVGTPVARLRRLDAAPAVTPSPSLPGDGNGERARSSERVEETAGPRPAATADHPERVAPHDRAERIERVEVEPVVAVGDASQVTSGEVAGGGVRASPLARRLAAERGIDLQRIAGSGPDGAVVRADLDAAADVVRGELDATATRDGVVAGAPVPAADAGPPGDRVRPDQDRAASEREPAEPDRMRRLIAERMSTANRDIPHYYLERDIDVTALEGWIAAYNEERPVAERILPAAAYIRAVALAASDHPALNGFWIDGRFDPGDGVNVAMAISLRRGGLVTPRIADADRRSVAEVMDELRELVAAARTGSLRASQMTGATITVTNLGDTGADVVHGVISPPQVALVGFGRRVERPWVVDDHIEVRSIVTASLAADHRATDGAVGGRFLARVADVLEHPEAS